MFLSFNFQNLSNYFKTQLLKKERRKPRQTILKNESQYDASNYTEVARKVHSPEKSLTLTNSNNNMSEGRKVAFERFRSEIYVESGTYR